MKYAFTVFLILSCANKLFASATSDLASPLPEVRAAAAKILRATYAPPPLTNWVSLLAKLKEGERKTNVEAILLARGIKPGLGSGEQLLQIEYRLDEAWVLRCEYNYQAQYRGKETLYNKDIIFDPDWVRVPYPSHFTGIWDEYYIDGHVCLETTLKDGHRYGDQTCYKSDDTKAYVVHWDTNGLAKFYPIQR